VPKQIEQGLTLPWVVVSPDCPGLTGVSMGGFGPGTWRRNEHLNSVTGLPALLRIVCRLTRETGNRATR
jgi:hypothetical protein